VWTSATQPYWFIWWAFVGASLVYYAFGKAGVVGVGAFYVGHVLADFVWFTLVAAAVGAGRKVLSQGAFRKLFVACGAMLLGFGLFFVAAGVFFPGVFADSRNTKPVVTDVAPAAAQGAARNSP
jgi:threonine/homoserine/homoserine lactone efflux protein